MRKEPFFFLENKNNAPGVRFQPGRAGTQQDEEIPIRDPLEGVEKCPLQRLLRKT
jgi:hypothetical protein